MTAFAAIGSEGASRLLVLVPRRREEQPSSPLSLSSRPVLAFAMTSAAPAAAPGFTPSALRSLS